MWIDDVHTIAIGHANDLRDYADLLSDTIAGIYAKRAGGQLADWREAMPARPVIIHADSLRSKFYDYL